MSKECEFPISRQGLIDFNISVRSEECVRYGTGVSIFLSSNGHAGISATKALIGSLPVCEVS